jgi:hypothetical protein
MKIHDSRFQVGLVVEMCGVIGLIIAMATKQEPIMVCAMLAVIWIGAGIIRSTRSR